MGVGIAKVHEEPITEQLGDMPIIALNDFGTDPLICTHHVPLVFRVELGGEFGGIHQVTEHHGELAAFGVRRGGRAGEAPPCAGETSGVAGSGTGEAVGGALDVPPVQTRTRPSSSTARCLA